MRLLPGNVIVAVQSILLLIVKVLVRGVLIMVAITGVAHAYHASMQYRAAKESSPIDCPRCQKQLNFNRGCENCKVLYAEAGKVCCPYCSDSIPPDTSCAESRNCESCGRSFQVLALPADSVETEYKDGKFIPVDPDYYHSVVRLEIPASLSNPKHFGHLAWKYCQFLASTEE